MFENPRRVWTKPPQEVRYLRPERVLEKQWAAFVDGFAETARDELVAMLNQQHGLALAPDSLEYQWLIDGNVARTGAHEPNPDPSKTWWHNAKTMELRIFPAAGHERELQPLLEQTARAAAQRGCETREHLRFSVAQGGGIGLHGHYAEPMMHAINRLVFAQNGHPAIDIQALVTRAQTRESALIQKSLTRPASFSDALLEDAVNSAKEYPITTACGSCRAK